MTSSESEGHPEPSRKRSRTSANSDDAGNKKARGRPRVDTQDATAADRRRTQIRLAQRAYRQRKESTITSLKKKNSQLLSIIDQLNKSFLGFNEAAIKSGLLQSNPGLGHELKHVTQTFVTLAKSAATKESHEGDEETVEPAADMEMEFQDATLTNESSRQPPVPEHIELGWGYSASLVETMPAEDSTSPSHNDGAHVDNFFPSLSQNPSEAAKQSSIFSKGPRLTTGQMLDPQSRTTTDASGSAQLPFGLLDFTNPQPQFHSDTQTYSVQIPTPELTPPTTRLCTPPLPSLRTKQLVPTWTYSHDESTFARRLTRAALECGFHLLSIPNMRPSVINHVFKLSLPYMSTNELRHRLRSLLNRGTEDELDCWGTPFIHLGGAGTHYPRKDANGNITPIPNAWNIRSIGPPTTKYVRAESSTDPSQSHYLNVDITGFEGEWFDGHDVEGYLQEVKGCHIDPKDSFAQVYIDDDEDTDMTGLENLPFSANSELDKGNEALGTTTQPQSRSPALSNGSTSAESAANHSVPLTDAELFSTVETFGLDMGAANFNDLGKLNDMNVSDLFDQPLGLDLAPGFGISTSASTTGFNTEAFDMSNFGLDMMGSDVELPVVKQKRKKVAWVDVNKLVEELIRKGVCLGRAPGFRRSDVDSAFKSSLISAF